MAAESVGATANEEEPMLAVMSRADARDLRWWHQ